MYTRPPQSWLIDDLVPVILESDDHWWARDLLRLARVSSAWLGPVRRRLYACPTLHSFHACSLLAGTLKGNSCLLPLLQGIDLRLMAGSNRDFGVVTVKEMASLRFILSLDGLHSVTLGGELAVAAERFLHSLANSHTVTELYIDGNLRVDSIMSRPPSLEWDEVMAFKFPSLKTLKLSNLDLDVISSPLPFQFEVMDLVLDNVNITTGYLSQLFLQSSSLQRLHVLTKQASAFHEQIRLILSLCAIQTLHYEVQEDTPSEQPIFDHESSPCSSLRHLHLSGVHVDAQTLTSIGRCCQNLEEMSISGRIVRVAPGDWVAFLNSGALPSLRDLRIPWGTYYPPFKPWSEVCGQPVLEALTLRDIHVQ